MGPNDVFVIASNNKGKIDEFKTLLSPAEIIPQSEIVQLEVDETGQFHQPLTGLFHFGE